MTAEAVHVANAREYETIYILTPQANASTEEQVKGRVEEVISKLGGKLLQLENWGRRRLAYSIDKQKRGIFVYFRYAGYNDLVAEIERNLRLLDPVIRYQTVRLAEQLKLEELSSDPEAIDYKPVEGSYESGEDDETLEEELGMAPPKRRAQEAEEDNASAEDGAEGGDDAAEASADAEQKEAARDVSGEASGEASKQEASKQDASEDKNANEDKGND